MSKKMLSIVMILLCILQIIILSATGKVSLFTGITGWVLTMIAHIQIILLSDD
jgi:hypothetical protein